MLTFTGHPLVDVGAATLAAMAGKASPEQLTETDLEEQSAWLARNYARNPLKSFLTVAFTSNAWFSQPSFSDARRAEGGQLHLQSWRKPGDPAQRCVFTGEPALAIALSDSLAPGRAARAQIPLAQGDRDFNFIPLGGAGLPVSGLALLCLQAFPLGCAKIAGRLLAVHSSDPEVMMEFADRFWRENARAIQLAQAASESKMAGSAFTLGTCLVGTLTEILKEQERLARTQDVTVPPASITAYYLTNGQTPELDIFPIPLGISLFLRHALSHRHHEAWQAMVLPAWQQPKPAKGKAKGDAPAAEPKTRRNFLYEDMLTLPDGAAVFLRRYFTRGFKALQPAAPWALTALFLSEVMNMDQNRIENLKTVADRLAEYIAAENDRKLFDAVYSEMRYGVLRGRLIKADLDAVRRGQAPLITFDQWMAIFEDGAEYARVDWKLARDVLLIRVIEQLSAKGWLAKNTTDLPDRPDDETLVKELTAE